MPLKNFWYYYNEEDEGKAIKYDWYTVSGAIASFNTEVSAPLRNLIANISYTQDLNGYSYPWLPGGGKNLLWINNGIFKTGAFPNTTPRETTGVGTWVGMTSSNYLAANSIVSYTIGDNNITVKSSANGYGVGFECKVTAGQKYTLSWVGTNAYVGIAFYDAAGEYLSYVTSGASPKTFTVPESTANAIVVLRGDAANVTGEFSNVQLEEGQTATAYSPYANICPITGYDNVTLKQSNRNIWAFDASYSPSGYAVLVPRNTEFYLPAGTYTFSAIPDIESSSVVLGGYYADDTQVTLARLNASEERQSATFTIAEPLHKMYLITNKGGTISDIQLELGSTASSYEPYNGQTVTIQLGQTVYGGTLDVTTGKLTVDRAYAVFDGSSDENWRMHGTIASWFYTDNAFTNAFTDASASNFSISNAYKQSPYGTVANIENGKFAIGYSSGSAVLRTVFKDTRYTTVQEWTNAVATNHIQLCYKLATPQTYQLTPTEVTALLGDNTIWADTGDVEVTYKDKAGKTITVSPLLSSVSPTAFRPALQIGKINFNDSDADDAESSSGESAQSEEESENFADEIMNGEEIADNGNEPVSEEFLDEDVEVTKDVAETDSEVGTETLIEETAEEIAEETAVEETLVEANEPTKNLEVTGR